MEYLNAVLYMIAGLGAFMIGFRLMSDSIKSVSDGGLKKLFKKTSDKPIAGFGVGSPWRDKKAAMRAILPLLTFLANKGKGLAIFKMKYHAAVPLYE